jgi:hypothetical protein
MSIIPNPSNSDISISIQNGEKGIFTARLIDMSGRIVSSNFMSFPKGASSYIYKRNQIAPGIYHLIFTDNKNEIKETVKLIFK